jgi:hypothetical protein
MFPRKKKALTVALGSAACLAVLAALPFVLTQEVSRVSSPDGRFYAVATRPLWESLVSVMPGHSSGLPGYIAIYSADGRSCGRVPVEMTSSIYEVEWSAGRAGIRLVAEWDLVQHRVSQLDR